MLPRLHSVFKRMLPDCLVDRMTAMWCIPETEEAAFKELVIETGSI